jgi:hypothetical protein
VTTEFLNLAVPEVRRQYATVVHAIERDSLPLPLVAINGEVKMAGGVDYYAIVSAVESLAVAGGSPTGGKSTPAQT